MQKKRGECRCMNLLCWANAGRRKESRRGRVVSEREIISCFMVNIDDRVSNLVTNSFFLILKVQIKFIFRYSIIKGNIIYTIVLFCLCFSLCSVRGSIYHSKIQTMATRVYVKYTLSNDVD